MAAAEAALCPFRRSRGELAGLLGPVGGAGEAAALLSRLCTGGEAVDFTPCVEAATAAVGLGPEALRDLFADMGRWALGALDEGHSVRVLPAGGGPERVSYTAAQCRGILANALFFNLNDTTVDIKDSRNSGGLDFERMIYSTKPVAAHKLACLLQYFATARALEGTADDAREVVFERRVAERGLADFGQWAAEHGRGLAGLGDGTTVLHSGAMEDVPEADAFVNFANPNFGYGRFISSCTQEEIIQVCCPEFNVGMLHFGRMDDTEVVVTSGVRRFSRYTGYLDGFCFVGPWEGEPQVQSILTMDATTSGHFTVNMVLRDIRKAHLAFLGHKTISTGRWGCGVFGGLPSHKCLQQLVAARLAGAELRFSTFGSPDGCDVVLDAIGETRPSVAQLLQALLEAGPGSQSSAHFAGRLARALWAPGAGSCSWALRAAPLAMVVLAVGYRWLMAAAGQR